MTMGWNIRTKELRLIEGGKDKSLESKAYRFSHQSLHWARVQDILKRIEIRGRILPGSRDHATDFL